MMTMLSYLHFIPMPILFFLLSPGPRELFFVIIFSLVLTTFRRKFVWQNVAIATLITAVLAMSMLLSLGAGSTPVLLYFNFIVIILFAGFALWRNKNLTAVLPFAIVIYGFFIWQYMGVKKEITITAPWHFNELQPGAKPDPAGPMAIFELKPGWLLTFQGTDLANYLITKKGQPCQIKIVAYYYWGALNNYVTSSIDGNDVAQAGTFMTNSPNAYADVIKTYDFTPKMLGAH